MDTERPGNGCLGILQWGFMGAVVASILWWLFAVQGASNQVPAGMIFPSARGFAIVEMPFVALFGFVAGAAAAVTILTGDGKPRPAEDEPAPDISGIDFRGKP